MSRLNKYGKEIKKLKYKYKDSDQYKVPQLKDPRHYPVWIEKEELSSLTECEECGGSLINPHGGSWVCKDCGLVHDKILDVLFVNPAKERTSHPEHRGSTESPYRKRKREYDHDKWVHKKMQEKVKVKTYISTEVRDKVSAYCKKNNLVMWKFISEVVLEAVLPETLEDAKNYE